MYPTNNLNPIIRYPVVVIVGGLSGLMFLGLMLGALKLGELIIGLF